MHVQERLKFVDFPRPFKLLTGALIFTFILLSAASWFVWQSHRAFEQRLRLEYQINNVVESVDRSRADLYLNIASDDPTWLQAYEEASDRLDSLFVAAIQRDPHSREVNHSELTDAKDLRRARVEVEATLLNGFARSDVSRSPFPSQNSSVPCDSPALYEYSGSPPTMVSETTNLSTLEAGFVDHIRAKISGFAGIDVPTPPGYENGSNADRMDVRAAEYLQALRRRRIFFISLMIGIILMLAGVWLGVVRQFSYYFTERQHAMRTLLESETRNIALLQAMPDTMLLMDREGHFLDYHAGVDMPGLSAVQFIGNNVRDGLPPPIVDLTMQAIEDTLDTGETQKFEYSLHDGDTNKHYEARVVSCGGDKALAIMQDITEKEDAERTVRETENKFRILVEQSLTGIYIIQDGRFVYVNPRFAEITGYDPAELTAFDDVINIVLPEERVIVGEFIDRLLAGDTQNSHFTMHGVRKDDRIIIAEVYGSVTEYSGRPAVIGTFLDITEQREAQEELRVLGMAVEQSAEGVLVIDTNGIVCFVNPAWARMHGFVVSEVTGKHFRIFHTADQMRREVFPVINRFETMRLYRAEMGHKRKDGTTFPSSTAFATLKDDNDRIFGAVAICRDITEQKLYEAELLEAKERAEDMSRMKSAILTNMSHEIRTPLTGIIGFAAVLEEEVPDPQQEFAHLIRVSGNRLMQTLNSVLDLARLEAGEMTMIPREVNLRHEVQEVTSVFMALARQKGISLSTNFTEQEIQAKLDPDVLNMILNNLIGNSVKFTDEGEINVNVTVESKEFSISVSDTGIGIDMHFLPHLFDEFKQESIGLTRSHEGSGLGLCITKRLVELMNGRIAVESKKGAGSTFTVTFPRFAAMQPLPNVA